MAHVDHILFDLGEHHSIGVVDVDDVALDFLLEEVVEVSALLGDLLADVGGLPEEVLLEDEILDELQFKPVQVKFKLVFLQEALVNLGTHPVHLLQNPVALGLLVFEFTLEVPD